MFFTLWYCLFFGLFTFSFPQWGYTFLMGEDSIFYFFVSTSVLSIKQTLHVTATSNIFSSLPIHLQLKKNTLKQVDSLEERASRKSIEQVPEFLSGLVTDFRQVTPPLTLTFSTSTL